MIFREAELRDIKPIMKVRFSVKENVLNTPDLVTEADCVEFIFDRGKGWVCEADGEVIGFSIVDLKDRNIWALFLDPRFEKRGIGRKLHDMMLDWYFAQTEKPVWLGTAPGTRAEKFYRKAGWIDVGMHGKEVKFEMPYEKWQKHTYKNMKNPKRRLIIITVLLIISIWNYSRIEGTENIRNIEFLGIFVIGMLSGLLLREISQMVRSKWFV